MEYKIYRYVLLITSLISISGAFVYKIYRLSTLGILLSLTLTAFLFVIILFLQKKLKDRGLFAVHSRPNPIISDYTVKKTKIQAKGWWLLFSYLFFLGGGILLLFQSQTTLSIISPWEKVPVFFFFIYFLSVISLYFNIKNNTRLAIYLIALHYLFSFCVALIVYKLGFGYDPFVHTATMEYIRQYGQALPKPFYYLGYYGLVIITHKLTFIPIAFLNKALVPFLAALLLPPVILRTGQKWFDGKKEILIVLLFLLILPFSLFIISTPQNLAYLFLAIILFYGVGASTFFDYIILISLSLAALSFQPITGLPALGLVLGLIAYHSPYFKKKKLLLSFFLFFNALILPLVFYFVTSANNQTAASINNLRANYDSIFSTIRINWAGDENVILNLVYFIIFNYKYLLLGLIITGLLIIFKYKKDCQILLLYFSFSLSLILSWALTRMLPFNFLIAYEQNNYTDRILINAGLLLLPMFFVVGHALVIKLNSFSTILRSIYSLAIALLITISLYQSYPRFDRYFNAHGFSVSKFDIEAVDWIKNNAKGDYIVLANQQVSAAALKEFGFSKYYKPNPEFIKTKKPELDPAIDIFYYPVPTGGPLYPYYLKMVDEKPSRSTILEAMDLTGVGEGYFGLNKYWWAFTKIWDEAKQEADGVEVFGDREVVIFRYIK